jgi:hypothetical protein
MPEKFGTLLGKSILHEVEIRKEKDLEEKRAILTQRVYDVLQHNLFKNNKSQNLDQKIYDKYERIVYADTEMIEKIFESTHDFYDAANLYEDHANRVAKEWELDEAFRLNNNESPKDNLEKFFHSIDCQKNMSKARILRIQASSHEHGMLLMLDGEQFLKDRGIDDLRDRIKLGLVISNELFSAKIHGLIAKIEAQARIKKENLKNIFKQSLAKIEDQAEVFVQE